MKRTTVILAFTLLPTVTFAAPQKDYKQAAQHLGFILAAEEFCGFKYNHNTVSGYVFGIVPPDEKGVMKFASEFRSSGLRTEERQMKMKADAKAAHCAEVRRSAKALKFFR